MLDLDSVLRVARHAAQEAGSVLKKYWTDGVMMRNKSIQGGLSYDLVSDADLEAEQSIAAVIRKQFPNHDLLGEEQLQGALDAEHLWVIDPLDGTNNFAHHLPQFAVSIAYCYRGESQVGVIFNPVHDDWYVAVRGRGATRNGQPVSVTTASRLDQVIIGCGFYYDRGAMMRATLEAIADLFAQQIHGIRRFGAASLDLAHVGCGQFGGFFEFQLSPWDFAAGRLFVEEAGGRVTTADGRPLGLEKSSVLASNGQLHDSILAQIAKHYVALKR